jgi:hypothetical protein
VLSRKLKRDNLIWRWVAADVLSKRKKNIRVNMIEDLNLMFITRRWIECVM